MKTSPFYQRRIFITGAARGLGAALVRALHDQGAHVVVADVREAQGMALVADLPQAHFISMDVSDPLAIEHGMNQAVHHLGGLDALVNNAAITHSGGVGMQDLSLAVWDEVMAVNVRAPWLLTRAAWSHLKKGVAPRVLHMASDTALWGAPNLLAYVASKGALMAMTRSMAREMGGDHITVNALAPGLTVSESTEYVPAERHAFYQMGRALPRPQEIDDILSPALFLLSPDTGFVTGQVLAVNGGFVM